MKLRKFSICHGVACVIGAEIQAAWIAAACGLTVTKVCCGLSDEGIPQPTASSLRN